MPFEKIYYIRCVWKSIVKVGKIKTVMGNNKLSTKRIFLSFFPKYGTTLKEFSSFNLGMTSNPNFCALSLPISYTI